MSKCPIMSNDCLGKGCAFWNEDCLIKLALQKYLDPLNVKKTNSYPFSFSSSIFEPTDSKNLYTDLSGGSL